MMMSLRLLAIGRWRGVRRSFRLVFVNFCSFFYLFENDTLVRLSAHTILRGGGGSV